MSLGRWCEPADSPLSEPAVRLLASHVCLVCPLGSRSRGRVEGLAGSGSQGVEFYQLLTYTDDVDLNEKLAAWERFYNYDRPHGAFGGKTPYEALRSLLVSA